MMMTYVIYHMMTLENFEATTYFLGKPKKFDLRKRYGTARYGTGLHAWYPARQLHGLSSIRSWSGVGDVK